MRKGGNTQRECLMNCPVIMAAQYIALRLVQSALRIWASFYISKMFFKITFAL